MCTLCPPNALVQLRAILVSFTQPNDLVATVCCNLRYAAGGECLSRKSWTSGGIGPSISAAFARIPSAITARSIALGARPPFGGCAISARKRRVSCQEREELLHATGAEDDAN